MGGSGAWGPRGWQGCGALISSAGACGEFQEPCWAQFWLRFNDPFPNTPPHPAPPSPRLQLTPTPGGLPLVPSLRHAPTRQCANTQVCTSMHQRGLGQPWEELELLPGDRQRWGREAAPGCTASLPSLQAPPPESTLGSPGQGRVPSPGVSAGERAEEPVGLSEHGGGSRTGSSHGGSLHSPVYTVGPPPACPLDNPVFAQAWLGWVPLLPWQPWLCQPHHPGSHEHPPGAALPGPPVPAGPSQEGQAPAPDPETLGTLYLPGQGQDHGTVAVMLMTTAAGPRQSGRHRQHPALRATLPPGTGCRSRAGDAVPGCSALRCACVWGRRSLSSSSLPHHDSSASHRRPLVPENPSQSRRCLRWPEHGDGVRPWLTPAASAWLRGARRVPLTPCPAPWCPWPCSLGCRLWHWLAQGRRLRCGCQAVLRFQAGEWSLFYHGVETKSTGDGQGAGEDTTPAAGCVLGSLGWHWAQPGPRCPRNETWHPGPGQKQDPHQPEGGQRPAAMW